MFPITARCVQRFARTDVVPLNILHIITIYEDHIHSLGAQLAYGELHDGLLKVEAISEVATLKVDEIESVDNIVAEQLTDVHYYNLYGQSVCNPSKGIYIVVGYDTAGIKVFRKVILR